MVDMVEKLEDLVWDAPTGVLRCVAGFVCDLAHGVGCFHGNQRVSDMWLTRNSLMHRRWDVKGTRQSVMFVSLRRGFGGRDWAAEYVS